MEIGKEIKQTRFSTPFHKAYLNLLYTANHFLHAHNRIFEQRNLLSQHYNVLRIARGKYPDPVSPGYIKDVMLDKGRDVTRLVDKLVGMEFLIRKPNPANKRQLDIFITEKGIDVTYELEALVEQFSKDNTYLSDTEYNQLSDLLDKMRG